MPRSIVTGRESFAMWAVMMIGMMTASAAPIILIYARVGRQASAQGKPFAATGWFATGYLLTWVGFALVATAAQWALERTALLDPMMAGTSKVFGGIVLIAAGVYQWTPLKDTRLAQCQSPLLFIHRHGGFHRDPSGSFALGLRHGAYCVGCCWVLMALLLYRRRLAEHYKPYSPDFNLHSPDEAKILRA